MYNEQEVLALLKKTAREKMPENTVVKLFGSRARGDAQFDSDWDILVLLDKENPTFEDKDNVFSAFYDVGFLTDQFINTVIYTKKKWQQGHFTPFYHSVEEDAIIL